MFEANESLIQALARNVEDALMEDIGKGDWTVQLFPQDQVVRAQVVIKQDGALICGQAWFELCITSLDPDAKIHWLYEEGQIQVNPKGCKILDTRKTIPGLRQAQKYAVVIGGGFNHRMGLWDGILIKENHIIAAGGISKALTNASELHSGVMIQVEVENLTEFEEALQAGAKHILIDDFSLEDMKRAVEINQGRAEIEVSGGVDLTVVRDIAMTGVDRISVGGLTKDVVAIDFSLRVIERLN